MRDAAAGPLLAPGAHSLLVHVGSHLVQDQLVHRGWAQRWADAVAVAGHPRWTWVLLSVALWTAVARLLDRHRIYLRP